MPCLYCGSNEIKYSCGKCHFEFCKDHYITTESYSCKKHSSVVYSAENAAEFDYRCTVVEKSRCPECSSLLMMDKLPAGQYYLKCTNCSWNSYSGTPNIHYITQRLVLQEASSSSPKLSKKPTLCEAKLKKNKGINICPNCFSQLLTTGEITSFATIQNMFNLEPDIAMKIINQLKADGRISGQIDVNNQVFIHIPQKSKEFIQKELKDNGKILIETIANRFNIPKENSLELMYEMLKEFQIHGTFDRDKKKYYTVKFLNDWLIKTINKNGRIRNEKLAKLLEISQDIIKYYVMELLKDQENNFNAYFADTGTEVVTNKKLKDELDAYSKQSGLFKLSEASEKFKVAVELVRRSLFSLIQEKKVRGIFTQKREFITETQLSEKIKNITKVYRTIKLRELARRIGITEVRVE
ncbi:MAG: hypothetical protein ACTSWY_06255, partial [Promethearchaeota archaeon]